MVDKDLSFRSYTDVQSLNQLKHQAKDNNPEALKTVAKQFESLFLNMLMQNMRKANESFSEGSYFDSNQTRFYRDMLDQQLSLSLSSGKGVGISEVLVKQLSPQSSEPVRPDADSNVERQAFEQALEASARAAIEVMAAKPGSNDDKASAEAANNTANSNTANSNAARVPANASAQTLPELRPGDFVQAIQAAERRLLEARSVEIKSLEEADNLQASRGDRAAAGGSSANSSQPQRFTEPQDFVRHIYPLAEQVADKMGVDPQVLVAQAALETGWGRHLPRNADGSSSFNLFGIKADQRWDGDAALVDTLEFREGIPAREKAAFRAYSSYQESLNDYVDFISTNNRYQPALEQAADGEAYLQQLQLAGYATDPEYARKIAGILTGDVLQTALTRIKEI